MVSSSRDRSGVRMFSVVFCTGSKQLVELSASIWLPWESVVVVGFLQGPAGSSIGSSCPALRLSFPTVSTFPGKPSWILVPFSIDRGGVASRAWEASLGSESKAQAPSESPGFLGSAYLLSSELGLLDVSVVVISPIEITGALWCCSVSWNRNKIYPVKKIKWTHPKHIQQQSALNCMYWVNCSSPTPVRVFRLSSRTFTVRKNALLAKTWRSTSRKYFLKRTEGKCHGTNTEQILGEKKWENSRADSYFPWSGVLCSMKETFSRVLWSLRRESTSSKSTIDRFICDAKLPGRSISSTGIRQMPWREQGESVVRMRCTKTRWATIHFLQKYTPT